VVTPIIHWPAEAIWEEIYPSLPEFSVEVVREIDSTNTELMRRARSGSTEPILLVAAHQTAGRGRLGREWVSEGGIQTLTFSLGMPLAPADWSGLSLAVGLSLVQSLHPALQLKWPNDVWFNGRKMAGILIETYAMKYAVIGIGINIAPLPAERENSLRTPSASLSELLPEASAPSALGMVATPLVRMVQQFVLSGFEPLQSAYHARDALYGQSVTCSDGQAGIARGVDTDGTLLLEVPDYGWKKINSAEVSVKPSQPINPLC
jgi:BirA family biotin operon repressor/biotin-[acetyl-CoA-carboxylase] ligase